MVYFFSLPLLYVDISVSEISVSTSPVCRCSRKQMDAQHSYLSKVQTLILLLHTHIHAHTRTHARTYCFLCISLKLMMLACESGSESLAFGLLVLKSTEAAFAKGRAGLWNDGGRCSSTCFQLLCANNKYDKKIIGLKRPFFLPLKRVLKVRLVWWMRYTLHARARVSPVNTF